ncbi:SDR family oxidoreductase [Actinomadura kijaniata]|uniref:Putative NADH-flavin reductase n=1 Tax=Actinomadura namibiensis TaxID=182080 RepID=A0A7W3LSS6_ACTNM|nr:SDR family oxidoreductase [Actinomadura namibiensis]MBA8953659.1 putative NADH-flavin reductase [Actinomadura namibiensis]
MKITVFGATGGTGLQVVRAALTAGHAVTAVVRDPAKLPADLRERVEVAQADAMDPRAVEHAVKGADAVITAIGTREGRAPTTVSADSARSIVTAMRAAGARRLLLISASALETSRGDDPVTRLVLKPLVQRVLAHPYADLRDAERAVRDSGLDWTIVRPPRLLDKPAKGSYRRADGLDVRGGRAITRADLGKAFVDLADDPSAVGRVVYVAN